MMRPILSFLLTSLIFHACLFFPSQLSAQGVIASDGGAVTINFDNSTPGILNGAFTAAGVFSDPPPGGLDSDGVLVDDGLPGAADQPVIFGANEAPFRYVASGNVSSYAPGIWAFDVNETSGRTLGFQPTNDHFGPREDRDGHVVFKFINNSGVTLTAFQVQYDIYEINDGDLNMTVQTYLTTDVSTPNFGPVRDTYYTTGPSNLLSFWSEVDKREFSVVSGISVPNGGAVYLRFHLFNGPAWQNIRVWQDELAIDNIKIVGASSTDVLFPCELPVANCKSAIVNLDDTGMATLLPESVNDGSTWECGLGLATVSPNNFDCSSIGSNPVTLTIRDVDGNTSSCNTTVTVKDKVKPAARCRDITLQLDASGNASTTIAAINNGSADACGIISRDLSKNSFDCSNVGSNTVVLTITDNNGNTSSCTSIVTVEDILDPTAICKDATVQLDDSGNASINAALVDNGSGDACGITIRTLNKPSFGCSDIGPNIVTLTVTDPSGLQDQCTATVTVEDKIVPVLTCPSSKVFIPNTDNCSFIPGLEDNSGIDFNLQIFPYTQYNPFGTPVLGSVFDNCAQLQILNDFTNSSNLINAEFPIGVTTVTYTVSDPGNNTVSCSFTVEIEANAGEEPELLTCPTQLQGVSTVDHPNVLEYFVDPGSCGKVLSFDNPTYSDCDAFTITQVGGYASDSEFPLGTTDFHFIAQDVSGNRTTPTCITRIIVKENNAPIALCKENLTIELDNPVFPDNGGVIYPDDLNEGSYDDCGGGLSLHIISNENPQARYLDWVLYCDDYDFRPLTLEVTDRFGNSSTCTTQVKLGEQPVAICKDIQVDVGGGSHAISPADLYAGAAFSPCVERFPPLLTIDRNLFGCDDIGEQTVTLTLTDILGTTTTCSSTITVVDGLVSSLNCGTVPVKLDNGEQRVIDISNYYSASDACTEVTVVAEQDMVTVDCDNYGENLVLITATDGNGNTRSCNVRINVYSEWAATCKNLTVELDPNGEAEVNHRSIFSYRDLCPTDPSIPEYNQYLRYNVRNLSGGEGFYNGAEFTQDYTFTLTAADAGDNSIWMRLYDSRTNEDQECVSIVTVIDNPAPVAICQNATVLLDQNGVGTLSVTDVDNGSYDENGTIVDRSLDITSFNCADALIGQHSVNLTVTDNEGRTNSCEALITVVDVVPPSVSTQSITVQLDENGNANINAADIDNGSSDACGIASLNVSPNSFDCSLVGDNIVTLTITDINGNVKTAEVIVTVEDKVTPTVNCQDISVQLDENGNASINANDIDNGSSDACGIANLSLNQQNFDCTAIGTHTVTLTATDLNGNSSSCTATVTVEDKLAPTASCQDISVQLDENGNASINANDIDNGSSDACGIANLSLNQQNFDCIAVGTHTVTLTATDLNGNSSSCTATVTVEDKLAPTASCQDISVQLDENGNASINANDIDNGSSDACGIANLSLNQQNFDCTAVGTHTITLTATDLNGNSNSCTATVTVEDKVAPTANCQDISVQLNENGNASINANDIDNGSSDACGIANLSLSQQSFDCSAVGTHTVTLTATDLNGNSNSCTATVTVEDKVAPTANCQDISVQLDENGNASINANDIDNGSSDACGIDNLSLSQQNFDCSAVGTHTVTLTATDLNGNSNLCTANVTIQDEIKPTLTCPQDVFVNTDPGECGAYVLLPKAAPADNCGIPDLQSRYRALDAAGSPAASWSAWATDQSGFFTVGLFEIQWRAKDAAGNEAFCSFQLEVRDEERPEVVCKNLTINFNGEASIDIPSNNIFDPTASFDACGVVSFVSQSLTKIDCDAIGDIVGIEVSGADPNGNTSTCTAMIEVQGMPCGFTATGIACEDGAEATYDPAAETFTLSAQDCSDYPDGEVSFVGTTLCGDGEIIVHVDALYPNARAGLAMMESSDPGARMVAILKDLSPRVRTEYRINTNGDLSVKNKNRPGVDWLRIVRTGNKFKTYTSTNGSYWRHAHTIDFEHFESCLQVGMITYTKKVDEEAVAVFSQLKISGENSSYTQSTIPPTTVEGYSASRQLGAKVALQVSPNPFQDETRINFTLDQAQQINLAIYNLQGQLVQRFEDSLLDAGEHIRIWEGTNQAGVKMPGGVYLIQLRVADQVINKRVILQQ